MPVSGVVLTCSDGDSGDVVRNIAGINGAEVHGVLPDGRIVAVLEAETVDGEVAMVTRLQELPGVISVHLAYHNFEDLEEERA